MQTVLVWFLILWLKKSDQEQIEKKSIDVILHVQVTVQLWGLSRGHGGALFAWFAFLRKPVSPLGDGSTHNGLDPVLIRKCPTDLPIILSYGNIF